MIKNNIHKIRKSMKITQTELAEAAGLSRIAINMIENYKVQPSSDAIFRISISLQRPVEEIFSYDTTSG